MCGVPDLPLYDGQSPAQRVSNEIFEDDFITCNSILKTICMTTWLVTQN